MVALDPNEYYRKMLTSDRQTVEYETAASIYEAARLWARLAERLMFSVKREGLNAVDPTLLREYEAACLEEPRKFASAPENSSPRHP